MQTISDNTLLDKLKTEDGSSFELLYKFYFPSVASYIKQNLGNNEDAEDIFQEAIIVLLQKVRQPNFILTSSLKTYLYAVAKNLWLKRLRDNKIKFADDELSLVNYKTESDIFELEPVKSKEEKVESWLLKITKNCQNVLMALFFYEVPMDSLMVKMGWKNKHTASNQKHKCIQQIKNIKEKEA
ncbi:MAG: sigma-70 family RNA polymerase sigma factor [Flavobacterium sp.]|nr:sigma-70 family RNA polymerase sigma factor [Flavobacterium sp.]